MFYIEKILKNKNVGVSFNVLYDYVYLLVNNNEKITWCAH